MKIKIYQKDLWETVVKSKEQQWRSLEHFLESKKQNFVFDDVNKSVEIEVSDKSDAINLMTEAKIVAYKLKENDETGGGSVNTPTSKAGRPKNMVFDAATGKGMTLKQHKKQVMATTLSKSEVVKRGIMSSSELNKAIASGKIQVIQVGGSVRITQEALRNYLT